MSAKAKTLLVRVLAGAGAISWFSFIELDIYFDHTRPHTFDSVAGRAIALNNHGSIAYLTRGENMFLYAFAWAAASFFVAAVVLDRTAKNRQLK